MNKRVAMPKNPIPARAAAAMLSLALAACSALPAQQTAQEPSPGARQPAIAKPAVTKPELQAKAHYDPARRSLSLQIEAGYAPGGFATQAIGCGNITSFEVELNGLGLGTGLLPAEANPGNGNRVPSTGCALTASFANVPVGKARVLSLKAYNSGGNAIPGSLVQAAFDLGTSAVTIPVNQRTTLVGQVLEHLNGLGLKGKYLIGKLDLVALQSFVDAITGPIGASAPFSFTRHPSLVDAVAIANALDSADGDISQLNSASPAFRISPESVSGTVSGSSPPYTFKYHDPASSQFVLSSGSNFTISGATPGAWDLEVSDSLGNTSLFPGLSSGSTGISISFGTSLPTPAWGSTSGPIGGDVRALLRTGSAYFAGTSSGLFSSSLSLSSWSATSLTNVKILSLVEHAGKLYAGSESNGIYISADGGSTWTPESDSQVTGRTIYRLISDGSRLFGATSEGVLELNGSTWSYVNLNLPVGARCTDIVYNGSFYWAAFPDSNQVFKASSPAGGWTDVTGLTPGFAPVSLSADAANVYAGGAGSKVASHPVGAGGWSNLSLGFTPQGEVKSLAVDTVSSGPFSRLFAAGYGVGLNSIDDNPSFGSNSMSALAPGILNPYVSVVEAGGVLDDKSGLVAGTQGGVAETTLSGGLQWLAKNTGMDATRVNDVVLQGNFAYAATAGSGVQRIDLGAGPTWTPLLGMPNLGGTERYPSQLAIDGNGTLYAVYGTNLVAALPAASSATSSSSWVLLDSQSNLVTDLVASSDNSSIYVSVDNTSGGGAVRSRPACDATCSNAIVGGWTTLNSNDAFTSLALSPDGFSRLYAGTEDGAVYEYESAAWSGPLNASICDESGRKVSHIAVSDMNGNHYIYFATSGGSDGLHKLLDTGSSVSCRDLQPQLSATAIHALAVDGVEPNLLFVAADNGIKASANATLIAPSFTAFNAGSLSPPLGNQTVVSLRYHDFGGGSRKLLAGTSGRGLVKSVL